MPKFADASPKQQLNMRKYKHRSSAKNSLSKAYSALQMLTTTYPELGTNIDLNTLKGIILAFRTNCKNSQKTAILCKPCRTVIKNRKPRKDIKTSIRYTKCDVCGKKATYENPSIVTKLPTLYKEFIESIPLKYPELLV